ncbi:MAG TPA: hypothetical protein PKC40_06850 [Saprospiraceae bacterium]|nr:hypothetical protein [Saprospiraceae bacterium]
MKKTIFSKSWKFSKFLPMMLGLVFMFVLGAASLNAQAFVDPSAATVILKSEIVSLESQIAGTNPNNNPSWEEKNNKINYYSQIVVFVSEGKSVQNSIFDGYATVLGGKAGLSGLTPSDQYALAFANTGNPSNPRGAIDPNVGGAPGNLQVNNLYIDAAIVLLKK